MSTIATLAIKLVGDTTQLRASFDQAAGIVQRTGQSMAGVGALLSGAVTAPLMGVGMTAIKVASDQEQLNIAFTTMLGSADKAKVLMEDLAQFSASTPFELPEVTGGAKQLMAFGVEAENVKQVLGRLGNLAAGVGANLGDLTYLYGTSRVQGRLFAADINQFTNRGIPLIEALAATMGVATGEIRGMVEEGKVGFEEMDAAIAYLTEDGGKFAGLMEAQSQSLQGLFSTAKDNVMLTLGEIGKVAIRELDLTPKLQQLIGVLEQIRAGVSTFAQENPQLFTSLIMVGTAVAALGPALTALGMALSFAAPAIGAIGGAIAALLSPVGLLIAAVGALAVAFATDFMGIRTAAETHLAPVIAWWDRFIDAFESGQTSISSILGELLARFTGLGNDTYDTTDAIQEFVKALGFGKDVSLAVGTAIWQAGRAVQAFGRQASDAIGAVITIGSGLVSFMATGQAPMGQWVFWWMKISDLIGREAAGAIIAFTKGPLTELRNDIIGFAADMQTLGGNIRGAIDSIVAAASNLAAGRTDFGSFVDSVASALAGIDWTAITEPIGALRDAVIGAISRIDWAGAFGQAVDAVQGLKDGIVGWLAGAVNGINWRQIGLNVAGFVDAIAYYIRSVDWSQLNPVVLLAPLLLRLVPGVGQVIGAANWVVTSENFGKLVQAVRDALAAIDWGALGESMLRLLAAVSEAIAGLDWSTLTDIGASVRDQVAGLFAGIQLPAIDTSGLTTNLAAVQEVMAPAFERLQAAFATLPASLEGLLPSLQGVAGAFGNLYNAIQPVLYAVGVALTVAASIGVNLFAAVIERLPAIVGPIIDQVALMINTVAEVIRGVTGAVSAIAAGDWAAAWESLKGVVQAFADFVAGTWTNVTTQLSGLGGAIGDAVVGSLADLGLEAAAATVQGILDNVTALGQKIAEVFSGELSLSAVMPEWITNLLAWSWPTFTLPEALGRVLAFAWPALVAPTWITSLLAWMWPSVPGVPDWVDTLLGWAWPALTAPAWITDLFSFSWPSLPEMPAWMSGFWGGENRAIGTSYFSGGQVMVGEAGPELVTLPRGSQIWSAHQTSQAGPGAGVTIQNLTVANEIDVYELLGKLEDLQRRRR